MVFLLHNAVRAECGGKITLFWIKMQVFGTKKNVLFRVSTPLIYIYKKSVVNFRKGMLSRHFVLQWSSVFSICRVLRSQREH